MQATVSPERGSDGGLLPGAVAKVLVVGAGVAGLQVARQLSQWFKVLVLESNHDVGGVWMANYIGYSLQVPWRMYQFPEFLWPPDLQPAEEYPTGQQVQAYIKAYASHFGLLRYIRLNSKLLRLRWQADNRTWEALYCDTAAQKFYKVAVDYVVMCTGIYSDPFIPTYPGAETFSGLRLHAKDFVDISVVKGRRVLIVGSGKTALDCLCGVVSSRSAASVTMLYRHGHWPVPRNVLGISIRSLLFNRAFTCTLPSYYTAGPVRRMAAVASKPLKRLFWKSLECIISRKFKISAKLTPTVKLPHDLFYGGQILDDRVDEKLDSEQLQTVKGEIRSFRRDGVELQDGSFRAVDVVLYCTGYDKSYEFLDGDMRSRLGLQKDGLYLYRNCLPVDVPHLAFVGSEVSSYNNILTSGLQAMWLAGVLTGQVQLPPPAAMQADISAQQRWRRKVMLPQRNRGAVIMLYMQDYHDQLLRDMGHSPRRKGLLHPFAECFAPYSAEDYGGLARQGPAEAAANHGSPRPSGLLAGVETRANSLVPDAAGAQAQGRAALARLVTSHKGPGSALEPEREVELGTPGGSLTRDGSSDGAVDRRLMRNWASNDVSGSCQTRRCGSRGSRASRASQGSSGGSGRDSGGDDGLRAGYVSPKSAPPRMGPLNAGGLEAVAVRQLTASTPSPSAAAGSLPPRQRSDGAVDHRKPPPPRISVSTTFQEAAADGPPVAATVEEEAVPVPVLSPTRPESSRRAAASTSTAASLLVRRTQSISRLSRVVYGAEGALNSGSLRVSDALASRLSHRAKSWRGSTLSSASCGGGGGAGGISSLHHVQALHMAAGTMSEDGDEAATSGAKGEGANGGWLAGHCRALAAKPQSPDLFLDTSDVPSASACSAPAAEGGLPVAYTSHCSHKSRPEAQSGTSDSNNTCSGGASSMSGCVNRVCGDDPCHCDCRAGAGCMVLVLAPPR